MQITAKDIMTSEVIAVPADWPVDRLGEYLVENSISGAPVVDDDDKLVGVVSLTDIVRAQTLQTERSPMNGPHEYYLHTLESSYSVEDLASIRVGRESSLVVQDIMTPMVFSLQEHASVHEIADAMIRGRIHRILVTRDDQVVGIVTALDMLKIVRDL